MKDLEEYPPASRADQVRAMYDSSFDGSCFLNPRWADLYPQLEKAGTAGGLFGL